MALGRSCEEIGCTMCQHMRAGDLPEAQAQRLAESRITRVYEPGQEIFCQGEMSEGLYCMKSGHAFLWHVDAFGYKTAFRVIGPHEIIGYRSCFGEEAHVSTAQALTTAHVCCYPLATLRSVVDANGRFARQFLRTMARDPGPADALLLRAQHLPIRVRLAYLLWVMKDCYAHPCADGALEYEIPLMRQDIASMLAVRPESVARAIAELKRDGIAVFEGRTVTVPVPKRLYQLLAYE